MRLINTKAHGIYDYVLAVILLNTPFLFDFPHRGVAYDCAAFTAVSILFISVITRYEAGIFRILPVKIHFWLDTATGIFLAASPWLFDFDDLIFKPHLVFGLSLIVVAILTDRLPHHSVMQMMGKAKKNDNNPDPSSRAKFHKEFHFVYSAGEELMLKLFRREIRR